MNNKSKILTLITAAILALTPAIHAQAPPQTQSQNFQEREEPQIQAAFSRYQNALAQKDGQAASQIISEDAIQVYEHYREAALTGTQEEIKQVPLIHQAAILTLRGQIPGENLINMNGKEIYSLVVSSGLIANKWAEAMEIIDITMPNPTTAILTIGIKDKPGVRMLALKEGQKWKFSIREILMQSNQTIESLLAEKNISQDQYLKNVVESQFGKGTFEKIWTPPATRIRKPSEDVIWTEIPQ